MSAIIGMRVVHIPLNVWMFVGAYHATEFEKNILFVRKLTKLFRIMFDMSSNTRSEFVSCPMFEEGTNKKISEAAEEKGLLKMKYNKTHGSYLGLSRPR